MVQMEGMRAKKGEKKREEKKETMKKGEKKRVEKKVGMKEEESEK